MKDIEDHTNRWKDIPCLWIGKLILLKWPYYPRQSIGSRQSLSNHQWHFSKDWNPIKKICMETKKTLNKQNNLKKEEWCWRNHAPWLQTIPQSYTNQNRHTEQWKMIESSEIKPHIYGQLIYDKGGKNIQLRKDSLLN